MRVAVKPIGGASNNGGKTFLQKLSDILSFNQNAQNADSVMAMGALLGNKQMQSTGQQLAQSNTENYLDSVGEFKYIAERGASGAAKGVENVVNALGYLGQMQNRAQVQQTAQTLGAWGALTGSENFKGASEHMDSYAQELKDTGLQDTVKFGTNYQQNIQERYADADITKTGKVVGDISETVGGLAPSAVMNVIAPGSGIVVSALGAGGNAMQEALANGASDHEALAYGTAVGVIEAATEKIFDGVAGMFGKGAADDVIDGIAKKLAKREGAQNAVVKIANGLGEGFEEFLTEFATRVTNEVTVDTDERSFLQTLGDAGYSFVMGSVLSGIVQTADGVTHTVEADPKGLAQQAANATLVNIKGQAAAQRIDSMRRQLMDMQRQRKVDALLAAYEKNVGIMTANGEQAISGSRDLDVEGEVGKSITDEREKEVESYTEIRYHKNGIIVVTDDWTKETHTHIPRTYVPYAVVDTLTKHSGKHDRTIYDANGIMKTQIHSGDHGNRTKHSYGKHGEHAHDYIWDSESNAPKRITRELTDEERIQHFDILKGDWGE